MTEITTVEYVDTGADYGFFGRTIARSDVRGMTDAEVEAEVAAMLKMLGGHVSARYVEEVPALTRVVR